MSVLEAIVLGIVQGLTEFLPISSTAHLRIVPAFLGWEDPGAAFTAITQLGTMLAVIVYFRRDLTRICLAWLGSLRPEGRRPMSHDAKIGWFLIAGTVPIVIFGATFASTIESGARSLKLIGVTLIALGLLLYVADRVGSRRRGIETLTTRDGLLIGMAQAVALIPGVSRSGATITAGLFSGLTREAAARFSFLLSVPAVVLSGLFELRVFFGDGDERGTGIVALVLATFLAFVVGYLSIAYLMRFLQSHSTLVFVAYRVVLGIIVLALAYSGVIS